jgi:hypothetical protein
MTEIIVKILVELLSTLALATRQIKQGKPSKSVFGSKVLHNRTHYNSEKLLKKLLGQKDVEVVVQRLDRLTQEEARMTAAQTLEVVHGLIQNMKVVMDGEQIRQVCRPHGVEDLPSRRQGIGRPFKGCPRYVFQATTKQFRI